MVDLKKSNISFELSVEGKPESTVNAAYIDIGNGPAILFIHGFFSDATVWEGITNNLKDKYRCISLDLLGFGNSSRLEIEYKVDSQVAFSKKFMEALGIENYFVVGHSLGSWTASRLEPVASESILGLVLLAPAGVGEYLEPYRILIPFSWKTPIIDWLISLVSPLIKLIGQKKLVQEIRFIREKFLHDPVFQAWIQRAFRLEISDELINEYSKNIHSPTFIICGESDETIPVEFGEHLEANISEAKLHVIPGADHELPTKYPQILSDLTLDFVSGVAV
ncbi:alpha/beta fold hydrolase [Acaryochloris marina NIES-2412]|uniref:alpha/beta fold hydrolase n=1 Tax=Acaryochloris marina TaxID=155978 RepID=UPI004058E127